MATQRNPGRLRNFVFTLNNYNEDHVAKLQELQYTYLVFGYEVGASGTSHLQGYCELKKQTRFNAVKKNMATAHIEKRKGTPKQAADYCKKDGKFEEYGEISRQGERTDLETVYNMVKNKKSNVEISDTYPATYMRNFKAIDRVRLDHARLDNKFEKIEVLVFVGGAGTGKTRKAMDIDPELYRNTSDGQWWDGYAGQETVLIDDFYGTIKYGTLLQLLDGYKFQLPIKGGFTWKQWKRIIITSNEMPSTWYKRGLTDALKRRITEVIKLDKVGE